MKTIWAASDAVRQRDSEGELTKAIINLAELAPQFVSSPEPVLVRGALEEARIAGRAIWSRPATPEQVSRHVEKAKKLIWEKTHEAV